MKMKRRFLKDSRLQAYANIEHRRRYLLQLDSGVAGNRVKSKVHHILGIAAVLVGLPENLRRDGRVVAANPEFPVHELDEKRFLGR